VCFIGRGRPGYLPQTPKTRQWPHDWQRRRRCVNAARSASNGRSACNMSLGDLGYFTDTMMLLLIGASVRAAAFSPLRAGLKPWCIDLFADADLQAHVPARRIETGYPHAFVELVERAPPGPWMFTGGLENWPTVVEHIARSRPLWG